MQPKFFYHCYDHNIPNGGQKDTYQHVELLNANGYEAYAVHQQMNYRLTWFDNNAPVIDRNKFNRMFRARRDFLVLPEDLGCRINDQPGRKVIFNKNLYHGFRAIAGCDDVTNPYLREDVIAVFSVSEHNRRHLQYAYPNKMVFLVDYDLQASSLPYRSLEHKRPLIAFCSKAGEQFSWLIRILKSRSLISKNHLDSFEWVPVKDMSSREVGTLLEQAVLFVSLSVEEGLPRLTLEAMAAGCLLAVYGDGPLEGLLPPEFSFKSGDLVSLASFIESIAGQYPILDSWESVTKTARDIALQFSHERQMKSVISAWEQIINSTPSSD